MKKNYFTSRTRKILSWESMFVIIVMMLTISVGNAQVTTNGGSGLAPTYTDLASAITALNGATITSPVVITLDPANPQTAPAGGYVVSAQGDVTNTILIQGSGNVITASGALTAGVLNDAIFKLIGADFVTLQGFIMQENAANTTTAAATNNMTEWGVALLYATTTNGSQNNTIQNNTISLNRTYQNTFGIYSNSTHALATPTTSATATTVTGGNHGLKVYTNAISNVNNGICIVGPTAAADQNQGLEIGGSALLSNTITNYGTTGTFSAYANVSGTVNGILVRNTVSYTISNNTITSSNGGTTAGTLRGIYVPSFSNAPTGTITNTINNNTISVRSGVTAGTLQGIVVEGTTVNTTTTLNINANDFNNTTHTTATASGAITFISNAGVVGALNVNSNTFTNLSVNTTGAVTFITMTYTTATATSTKTVTNNAIITAFAKTGANGNVLCLTDNGSSITGTLTTVQNNNFSNISVLGTSTIIGINLTDGGTAPTKNITNNTLSNWTGVTGTLTPINITYWNGASILSNNTVSNINGQGAITGINMGSTVNTATSVTVSSNTITGLSSTGVGGAVSGIICNNTSPSISFIENAINTLSSTGAFAVNGITISGATSTNVIKNKIYNLSGSNASSTVNGLNITAGTLVTAYNNIIGDLRTPNANAANPLNGINITGGTTVNVYNNTVLLNGTSAGALFGSSAVSVSATPTVTLRNNIFVNSSTANGVGLAVAHRRSTTTLTSYGATSNNNLFYASNIFTDGTNTDATLAAYKARVASRDASSVSENPTFVSTTGADTTFLHIDTAVATQIESGGATIATVTDDFDGDVRNATTPDIGADEFAGIVLDITGPTIVYTAVGSDCTGGTRTISATITDASGVPISGVGLPVVYYAINAGAYTAATGVSMGAGVYNFSIGTGSVLGDVITYYFVAQDTAGTPNTSALPGAGAAGFTVNPPAVATAPTTPFSYTVIVPLNGVYTVGAGGNYTTLTAAVADYNTKCMTGPVTFSLTDATYPSETFPITINQNADASAVNTLTIKPATGVTPTISGSLNGAIFVLNGADYVIVNGSSSLATAGACLVGGDAAIRELTFQNTNVGTAAAVISVQSGTNGAQNNVVKNINVIGQDPTTTLIGISLGGNTPGTIGTDNDNNRVENCSVQKAIFGIYAAGASLANQNTGTVIKQNDLTGTTTNRIRRIGIIMFNDNGAEVSYNNIAGIDSNESADVVGIAMGNQAIDATIVTNGGITGAVVSNNRINGINSNATAGFSAAGITIAGATGGFNTIQNNMISGVISNGTSPDFPTGIYVVGAVGSDTRVFNNTISMTGDRGATAAQMPSYGIAVTGADELLQLKNNIIVTSQTASGGGVNAKSYAIGLVRSVFANLDSNYNDFVSSGANDGGFRTGALGTAAGTDYTDVATWSTAVADDANSVEITPVFLSASDLHLDTVLNPTLDNLGTPIAAVTQDYDCEARNATTPDMGADEGVFLNTNQFDLANGLKAYPNPVNNILNIEYTSDLSNVSVYNMLGQQVLAKKVTATSTQLDLSGLNAGTYLVKVEAGTVSTTLKVFKK